MDFLELYKTALEVTGTVELPFPFPAFGCVYLVAPAKKLGFGPRTYFIKIVEVLNVRQFITRFVELKHLRAVKVPDTGGPKSSADTVWVLKSGDDLRKDIEKVLGEFSDTEGENEAELYPKAIVIVQKSAPVITRYEFAMTAEEFVEDRTEVACPVCPPPHWK